MQVFLLRHGIAGVTAPGGADRDRTLTPEGREQVRRVLERAAGELASVAIVSSPYRRAIETAEIATRVLGVGGRSTSGALTPDSHPEEAWEEIRTLTTERSVLLVGHEPLFSALAAYLVGSPNLELEFGTATLAAVQVEPVQRRPQGKLRWLLTPALCR